MAAYFLQQRNLAYSENNFFRTVEILGKISRVRDQILPPNVKFLPQKTKMAFFIMVAPIKQMNFAITKNIC